MTKLLTQPMYWIWLFVGMWGVHVAYTLLVRHWTGVIISLTGLISALLIVSAVQSRRRKNMYPRHGLNNG